MIDPSAKGMRELPGQPYAADWLLEHELGTIAIEIGEFLVGAIIENAKAEEVDIKTQAALEIRAIELCNQFSP